MSAVNIYPENGTAEEKWRYWREQAKILTRRIEWLSDVAAKGKFVGDGERIVTIMERTFPLGHQPDDGGSDERE